MTMRHNNSPLVGAIVCFAVVGLIQLASPSLQHVVAFAPTTTTTTLSRRAAIPFRAVALSSSTSTLLRATAKAESNDEESSDDDDGMSIHRSSSSSSIGRRELFEKTSTRAAALAAAGIGLSFSSDFDVALADEGGEAASPSPVSPGSTAASPIVILGAGGKVGKLCTKMLTDKGLYCRAVTRSGRQVLDGESPYVTYASGDVTKYDALKSAIDGSSGVIFAASASGKKKGGDPAHVDYLGLANTGKACIECSIPKLVVISAGTVTRPDSLGYKATNFFVKYVYGENIMGYKIAGEAAIRDMYGDLGSGSGLSYAVIRPGGLNDKPSVGSNMVHISQGDVYSSDVTREDVALVTVETLLKGKDTDNVTFELNQVEGLIKAMSDLPDLPGSLIHTGKSSYGKLLDGLLTDKDMKKNFPSVVSDYRGGKDIAPLSSLV